MDKVFDVSIFVHPIETSKVLRQFQRKVAEVQSQIHTREEKGLVRDPMLDVAYQDLENLRDQLTPWACDKDSRCRSPSCAHRDFPRRQRRHDERPYSIPIWVH
jgi:hypothetical protein